MKADIIVGGDPILMRAASDDPLLESVYRGSIEVPCQTCGRTVILSPSGQRVALEAGAPLVHLDPDALKENRLAAIGPVEKSDGPVPVVCMWCGFEDSPDVIAAVDQMLADARRKLGYQ